jgi:SAM-dependent methyltransferase
VKPEYIFDRNRDEQERLRLRLIEKSLDPATTTHIRGTGIGPGWHCLELGPGAGSVMRWMGEIAGAGGRVVGIDKNTNHLRDLSDPPFRVVAGDFLEIPLDTAFDLAHCRYVLIHNCAGDEMLDKLASVLKPGGFLVVEEPDFTSAKLLNTHGGSQQRVNSAICRMFEEMELEPAYGLSLPEKVSARGLRILQVDSRLHLARGGDPIARMMGESTRALGARYVETGEAGPEDIEAYIANANDERCWGVWYSTVSVIAAKSGTFVE